MIIISKHPMKLEKNISPGENHSPIAAAISTSLFHRGTGVEAQARLPILMARGGKGCRLLQSFIHVTRSEKVLPLKKLLKGALAFSALCQLCLWLWR